MAISVIMPALEVAQETAKLVAWLKNEGDSVRKGELLLEIETDKATMEVEAEADGTLAGVTAKAGEDVPVGQVVAWLLSPGERVPVTNGAVAPTAVDVDGSPAAEAITPAAASTAEPPLRASGQISPKARRLAKEAGVDLTSVQGTGPSGEILASDIRALIEAKENQASVTKTAAPAAPQLEPLTSIGRLMAERTTQGWTTVPHFFIEREVDASALNEARAALGAKVEQSHGLKLTHTDLLAVLVARVLIKHSRLNASWIDGGVRLNPDVNISIAIAVPDGVVAPVVANPHNLTLAEIAGRRRDLTERARGGRLRLADLSGGTFTISNLGMFHVDSFSAIITPPQAAVLAVGAIKDRVVPIEGGVGVRPMLVLTLSVDHRVADGAKAAAFLHDLVGAIEEPAELLSPH
ncbi:MAG: dihydrolipoamide acetyltransferase family protein [Terracidiphilus sp.]|jgi:pyruvate dehydrogenase E2 component (dihydrolipoamide acetyltransferase)